MQAFRIFCGDELENVGNGNVTFCYQEVSHGFDNGLVALLTRCHTVVIFWWGATCEILWRFWLAPFPEFAGCLHRWLHIESDALVMPLTWHFIHIAPSSSLRLNCITSPTANPCSLSIRQSTSIANLLHALHLPPYGPYLSKRIGATMFPR